MPPTPISPVVEVGWLVSVRVARMDPTIVRVTDTLLVRDGLAVEEREAEVERDSLGDVLGV